MDESQRKSMSMVFVLVVSAVFCAVATFIGITLVANRDRTSASAQPELPDQILIDDLLITLHIDPEKAIFLPEQPAGQENQESYPAQETISAEPATAEAVQVQEPPAVELPSPTPQPAQVITIEYLVQPGDTLYSIAQSQNSSIELMAINGIDSGDIVPGSVLAVPAANPAFCPGMRPYIVRENDTVFSLARTHGTTPEAIITANNLDGNATIYTTSVICLP